MAATTTAGTSPYDGDGATLTDQSRLREAVHLLEATEVRLSNRLRIDTFNAGLLSSALHHAQAADRPDDDRGREARAQLEQFVRKNTDPALANPARDALDLLVG